MTENKNNAPAKSMPEKKMSSGVVMLYNRDGGFGFVRPDAGGKDLYFSIHEVEGTQVPKVGDKVEFTVSRRRPRPGKALPVECLRIVEAVSQRNKANRKKDERIECPHCGRKVVPRISFFYGTPEASYCPYCAGLITDFCPRKETIFSKIGDLIGAVAWFGLRALIGFLILAAVLAPLSVFVRYLMKHFGY